MHVARVLVIAASVLPACSDSSKVRPTSTETGSGSPPVTVSKDAAGAPAPPPTESEELEKAKKVLAVWLASQNAADFDAYKELYGKGFRGVRMSTDKRVDLDRDAWLKDRARMFSKRMVVTAEDLRFSRADEASTIDFVQTWKSGTFADVGEKRLVLRPEGGELRIVSEEMLTSEKLKPEAGISVSHLYPRRATRQFKVGLGKSAASPTFAHRGKPNAIVVSEGEGRWATKRVDHIEREVIAASLPHALRELAGRSLEVFGPRGKVCDTKVESFREVRKPTALSMVIKRRKTMRDSGDHDALASELWPDLPQGKLVVEVAGCDGLWAMDAKFVASSFRCRAIKRGAHQARTPRPLEIKGVRGSGFRG